MELLTILIRMIALIQDHLLESPDYPPLGLPYNDNSPSSAPDSKKRNLGPAIIDEDKILDQEATESI